MTAMYLKLTWDAVMITEGLELALGPRVQNPVLHAKPGVVSLVLRLIPDTLNLVDERVLGGTSRVLGLDTLLLQVVGELDSIPLLVGSDHLVIPVGLDELLKLLAVGRCRVGDVVVRKPSLELSLVPLVVSCEGKRRLAGCQVENCEAGLRTSIGKPRAAVDSVGHKGQGEEGLCDPHRELCLNVRGYRRGEK